MNEFVYNNRVFYFNSKKYSVDYSKENIKSNTSGTNVTNGISGINKKNKENNIINLIINVVPKHKKKKEVPAAGKGYVAARALKKQLFKELINY